MCSQVSQTHQGLWIFHFETRQGFVKKQLETFKSWIFGLMKMRGIETDGFELFFKPTQPIHGGGANLAVFWDFGTKTWSPFVR